MVNMFPPEKNKQLINSVLPQKISWRFHLKHEKLFPKTGEQRFRGQQRKDPGKTGNAHETRRCSALTPGRARSHCARSHRAINTRETCTLRVTKARDWAHMPARLGAHACSCRSTRNRVPGDDLPGGGCRLARALVVHGPR